MYCYTNNQSIVIPSAEQFKILIDNYHVDKISNNAPPGKCRIWLVRHGESESNSTKDNKEKIRIAGNTDSPLTVLGFKQASDLANLFLSKEHSFSAFYSSPLSRAFNTADTIKKTMESKNLLMASETKVDKAFLETNYGSLDGATGNTYDPHDKKMKETLPQLAGFEARMDYLMVPNMESNKQVYERVMKAVLELAKKHLNESICITSHNGPLKSVFMHLIARDSHADVMYHTFDVGNCAALCLESDGEKASLISIHNISWRNK